MAWRRRVDGVEMDAESDRPRDARAERRECNHQHRPVPGAGDAFDELEAAPPAVPPARERGLKPAPRARRRRAARQREQQRHSLVISGKAIGLRIQDGTGCFVKLRAVGEVLADRREQFAVGCHGLAQRSSAAAGGIKEIGFKATSEGISWLYVI